ICDRVIGKCANCCGFELIVVQTFTADSNGQCRPVEHLVQLDSKDEQTASQADEDKIKPDGNAAPEMDLEKRSPSPHALRPPPQTLEKGSAVVHRVPCSYCFGFVSTSRPTRYRTTANAWRGIIASRSEYGPLKNGLFFVAHSSSALSLAVKPPLRAANTT